MGEHNFFKGSRTDEWETPPELFHKLNAVYSFKIDLAASNLNRKCETFYSKEDSSLEKDWSKLPVSWLNPPFSMAKKFFNKAATHKNLVCIYKSANLETRLWQEIIIPNASWICFLKGRTNYINSKGVKSNGVTFGSALIGYGVKSLAFNLGVIWELKK